MAKICITMKEIRAYEKEKHDLAMAGATAKHYIKPEETLADKLGSLLHGSMGDNSETKISLLTIYEKAGYDYALLCATILKEHNYKWRELIIWYLDTLFNKGIIDHPMAVLLTSALRSFNNSQITEDEFSKFSIQAYELVKEAYANKVNVDKIKYLTILASALTLSPGNVMLNRVFISDPHAEEKFLKLISKE